MAELDPTLVKAPPERPVTANGFVSQNASGEVMSLSYPL
jgi:hypothetical protein